MAIDLEILSPAGNAEIGIAAIEHGADAVYIGAPKFSARAEAGTSIDDIGRLIQYAHLYYAGVYVALNTILTDAEIPEAVQMARAVFELGADGLIIQDLGLLETDLPPIPLIASTQMHNNTVEKIHFLEAVGFKRVILPREFSLKDIAAVRKNTRIKLEAFVYGALCVSYSGQCYMSQAITGRSGNRGVCTQPCRSRYTLVNGRDEIIRKDRFLLSPRDLNLMHAIPDLVAAGITSFKIEGRYKSIDYVKNVTAAFRQTIDTFMADNPGYVRSSSGTSRFTFSPDPAKTFNRGYTEYFIRGRKEKVGSVDTQKSIGKTVGRITGIGKGFFHMQNGDLENGDGLCFFTKENELAGFRINRIDKDKVFPSSMNKLEVGTRLYRNHDTAFTRLLKRSSAVRRIDVDMSFAQERDSIRLTATDEDGNTAEVSIDARYEPAKDPSLARQQVERQLSSSGNTPYHVQHVIIHPQNPGFLSPGVLNRLRRDVLEKLTRSRLEKYPHLAVRIEANSVPYPETHLGFEANVLNHKARAFYKRHRVEAIESAFEALSTIQGKQVMSTRFCVRHEFDLCHGRRPTNHTTVAEPLWLIDKHHKYRLEFDCRECRMHVIIEK